MKDQEPDIIINKLLFKIEELIPFYMKVEADRLISEGNVAVCIIDETGMVYGRMIGSDKPRLRRSYRLAWTKASQVWLTGVKTGEYERMVFNREVDENATKLMQADTRICSIAVAVKAG